MLVSRYVLRTSIIDASPKHFASLLAVVAVYTHPRVAILYEFKKVADTLNS